MDGDAGVMREAQFRGAVAPAEAPAPGRTCSRSPVPGVRSPGRTRSRTPVRGARSLLLAAALVATPALAQDFPKLKPGLWEMQRSSDREAAAGGAPAQPNRMTMCLDDSVQREMVEMGGGAMKGMCSKHEFTLSGNRGRGDFVCDVAGTRMHSKSTMTLQGNVGYRTEIDTTYDPPLAGRAHTRTIVTARYLGACKPGQRAGDMIMPNGQTMNMRDIMSGKGSITPPPRTR
jgi:hypothetical protein